MVKSFSNRILFATNLAFLIILTLNRNAKQLSLPLGSSSSSSPSIGSLPDSTAITSSVVSSPETSPPKQRRVCKENPFLPSILDPPEVIADRVHDLRMARPWATEQATLDLQDQHNSKRFRVLHQPTTCNMTCVGGNEGDCKRDGNYWICGFELKKDPVLYSIGCNNKWKFEYAVLQTTPYQVHTFDCTGDRKRFDPLNNPSAFFHYECLAGTAEQAEQENYYRLPDLVKRHNHSVVDLIKMDIEGYEWDVFKMFKEHYLNDPEHSNTYLPMQIVFEMHFHTIVRELEPEDAFPNWKTELDFIDFYHDVLLDLGYIIAKRMDHRRCPHCTELTLMRYYC